MHDAGVLHGDVGLSNFLLAYLPPHDPPRVLLADFGMSRAAHFASDAYAMLAEQGELLGLFAVKV